MPSADRIPPRTPESLVQLGWLDVLNRLRLPLYALVVVFYIAAFNGIWRVGVDSALYRGLARSLSRGQGYMFAGEHHQHAYPGLPWMLSLLERLFGESPVPGLILMTLMALATLWIVDRTIALRYPLWMATLVTLGMAFNVQFVRQSQQLMTDVPFTLGVVATFYTLERLRIAAAERAPIRSLVGWSVALVAGLGLAAATRPTFYVLAAAIVLASIIRVVRGTDGRRLLHGGILAAALLVLLGLFLADPRTTGISPLQGVYEQELVVRLQELPQILLKQIHELLARDLNDAFFSQRFWLFGYVGSLTLLFCGGLVLRRNLLWGLTIFGLVAITIPLSTVPRYYIMVMPLLWLGWMILACHATLRSPAHWQGPLLALFLALPLSVNVARSIGFIIEQRKPDIAWLRHGTPREEAFYKAYRAGTVIHQRAVAKMIADHSTLAQKIVGPDAHVLAYFAERRVIGERTLFIDREVALSRLPKLLAEAKPDLAIFPVAEYGENDSLMRDLIRRRILVAGQEVARVEGVQLATATIRLPPAGVNWKSYKPPAEASTTRRSNTTQRAAIIAKRERRAQHEVRSQRAERLQKQAKLDRRAKIERQQKRDRMDKRDRAQKRAHSDHPTSATSPS